METIDWVGKMNGQIVEESNRFSWENDRLSVACQHITWEMNDNIEWGNSPLNGEIN